MRRVLWFGALLVILNLLSAATAMADETLDYTLTEQGVSTPLVATWQMSLNPTPTCPAPGPCSVSGDYFAENVEISIDGGPATPDTLIFFNTTPSPIDLNDLNFSIPEFTGPQLYTGDEGTPTMSIGSFTLTDDGETLCSGCGVAGTVYTLDVTAVPEPSGFLLMATGLICAGFAAAKRRRSLVPHTTFPGRSLA